MKITYAEQPLVKFYNQVSPWYGVYDSGDGTIVAMFWCEEDARRWAQENCYEVRAVRIDS